MKTTPRLYLGTMTFAWSQTSSKVDDEVARAMVQSLVDAFPAAPFHRIDTARIYAGGDTEPCVAKALLGSKATFLVGTKAHPSQPGGLSKVGIQGQWQQSLAALQADHFEEYYLHQPDPEHSLLESLQCLHSYCEQGLISSIGMSNYHASEMVRAFALCREHQLTPPTVYQGLYNPLNRLVERDLLPVLRQNRCSFVAYNPLAAGLLTGKHHLNSAQQPEAAAAAAVPKGRFQNNPNYLPRFYTDSNFQAVELIRQACQATGLSMIEATYRWLLCHSALGQEDGVLLGASSLEQLNENLGACQVAMRENEGGAEPLPNTVLQAMDDAWKLTEAAGVFPYWRSYSLDMPDREILDPGASYDAAKKKS